jgi:hypothetical protein
MTKIDALDAGLKASSTRSKTSSVEDGSFPESLETPKLKFGSIREALLTVQLAVRSRVPTTGPIHQPLVS